MELFEGSSSINSAPAGRGATQTSIKTAGSQNRANIFRQISETSAAPQRAAGRTSRIKLLEQPFPSERARYKSGGEFLKLAARSCFDTASNSVGSPEATGCTRC
jgi:hypothetical protein